METNQGMDGIILQLERIKEKLERLKELDGKRAVFGSESHDYHSNHCLQISTIKDFEVKHDVDFPEDYVLFLTKIGNGGAGPFYGIEPLENILYVDLDLKGEERLDPSKPFRHRENWNMLFSPTHSLDENEDLYYSERDTFDENYMSSQHIEGSIRICNYGCGIFINLVVSGPEKGYVWTDGRADDKGIYPSIELGNTDKIKFLDWYELWLDKSLEILQS
jgi:hypothetical protein